MKRSNVCAMKEGTSRGTAVKRKEQNEERVLAKTSKKAKQDKKAPAKKAKQDKKSSGKKGSKKEDKEFWVKLYTSSSGVRVMFSDEAMGPYKSKEEVLEAVNEKVDEIENNHGIDIPPEDFVIDKREKIPARGKLLVIRNCHEKYHFDMSTKKPKIFDGHDSDDCPF